MPNGDSFGKARRFVARQPRWLKVSAILLFVYCVLGFLVLPWILRPQLEKRLATALHRHVAIAKLRMNPVALSVTIDGLQVDDPDGSRFLSWERLYLRANLWPILKRELTLNTLYLLRFRARASIRRDGKLNFEDLLTSSGNPEPPSNTAKKKSWFTFGVDHLSVVEADAEFSDLSHPHPFRTTVGPFTFHLEHLRTRADAKSPYDLTGTTESGERFSWAGAVHTEPFRSEGMIAFENVRIAKYAPYYEQQVGFDVQSGLISLRTRYQLELGSARQHFRTSEGEVALRTLAIALRGHKQPALQLAEMNVAGISIAPLEGNAEINSVQLRGAVVRARRERDGQIDLTKLVPPPAPSETSSKSPTKTSSKTPFRWAVRRVELSNGRVELEDAAPDPPVRVVLAPIEARVENLASTPRTTSTLQLSSGWNETGRVNVSGTAVLDRPSAEMAIRITDLDLSKLDPYLRLYGGLAARLTQGRLSLETHGQFDLAQEPLSWAVAGDLHIDGFSLEDSARSKKLLSWKELRIAQFRAAAQPPGTSLESVRLVEPRLAIEVAEDRSSNLQRIMPRGASQDSAPTRQAPPPATSETAQTRASATPYPLSIGTVQITSGVVGFVDRSIQPTSSLAMNSLDVRVRNFSMDVDARSSVSLKALIDKAPFKIAGTVSPRMVNNATDLKIDAKGIDLIPLGPYVGKYLGYRLEKGELDLDLRYKVARRKVDASNLFHLDDFTLGDSTNSPDATKLPVKLTVAVMRDRDGVIEFDAPVTGNLDDPNFRVGRVLWKELVGIFTRVATSPFTWLAKLFGGGSDSQKLDVVDFDPGSSALTASTDKSLRALAKALYSRPALQLDVEGSADEKADGRGLRVAELHRRGQEAKWKASQNHSGASSPEQVQLPEDEYAKFIESTYQTLPRGVGGAGATAGQKPTLTEMENQVLATIDLSPEAISKLAQQRAEAARARIVQAAQVEPARLSLVQGGARAKKEGGAHVYFTLK